MPKEGFIITISRKLKAAAMLALAAAALASLPAWAAAGPTYIVNGVTTPVREPYPGEDCKKIESLDSYYNRYTDYANGYSILYPAHMEVDASLSAVRTVFSDEQTRIEVYYDDFSNTGASANDYIYYGNRALKNSAAHTILADTWLRVDGRQTHLLEWKRPPLSRVPGDRNNYLCAEIVKNAQQVYTVFVKSSQPTAAARDVAASLRLFTPQGEARNIRHFAPSRTPLNAETKAFREKFFGRAAPLRWGVFEPSAPQTLNYLTELESKMDYRFPVLLHYQMFDEQFPVWGLQNAYQNGKYVELTLQTAVSGQVNALWSGGRRNETIVYEILDGKYDDYFADYALKLKEFGHPVLFRLNNEMNGDWCWYSAYYTGKDAELYAALWRYIYGIFESNGVDNVLWVWNPHDVSLPNFKWNHYLAYYPGDEYVDVIGLTGYNNGTYFPGERWREFMEIYPPLYEEYNQLFDKPFMITEFAANSVGGDKAAWIGRMFDNIGQFKNIKVAVWWSGVDYDQQGRPGRIYLIDEDEEVINAFRTGLKDYRQ